MSHVYILFIRVYSTSSRRDEGLKNRSKLDKMFDSYRSDVRLVPDQSHTAGNAAEASNEASVGGGDEAFSGRGSRRMFWMDGSVRFLTGTNWYQLVYIGLTTDRYHQ